MCIPYTGKKGRGKGGKKAVAGSSQDDHSSGTEWLGVQQVVMVVLAQTLKAQTDVLYRCPHVERARMVEIAIQAVSSYGPCTDHTCSYSTQLPCNLCLD